MPKSQAIECYRNTGSVAERAVKREALLVEQTRPLLVHPTDWPVDSDLLDDRGRLRGAETVHRQLVRWLERLGHRTDLVPDPRADGPEVRPAAAPAP